MHKLFLLIPSVSLSNSGIETMEVQHGCHQLWKIKIMFPSPVLPSIAVIKVHWPTVGYGLSNRIHVVSDLEFWYVLQDLLGQFLGGEAHGVDVVGPHGEGLSRGFHHFQGGPNAVIDVHHREPRAGFQVALEFAILYSIVENLDCVVRCSSSRLGVS